MAKPRRELRASGFFVLRTPLLPFEEVEGWISELEAPAVWQDPKRLPDALAADRQKLRERLARFIERPEIREALFVAAPALDNGIEAWRRDPDGKNGRRAEETLVRYFLRMASRPTPFGLFAGCSLGKLENAPSDLRLQPRAAYRRNTRLDNDYLFALTEDLGRDAGVRRQLRYRPNSSLYRVGRHLRYAEGRLEGKRRLYHLVSVETDEPLEAVLRRAGAGATIGELVQDLVESDPDGEILAEDAAAFVEELIDAQVLVTDLKPPVTGREPIHEVIDQLAGLGEAAGGPELPPDPGSPAGDGLAASASSHLRRVRQDLAELDAAGLGRDSGAYRAVARRLESLPTSVELPRLFQVDMTKPVERAVLGADVVAEIERGVGILRDLAALPRNDPLSHFRDKFVSRYEGRQKVPLVEALDEELGIGFDTPPRVASALLDGLNVPSASEEPLIRWDATSHYLLTVVERALKDGLRAVEVSDKKIAALGAGKAGEAPDSFQAMATLAAASPEALAQGDFQVLLHNFNGPSGARLLGRFCHVDPDLAQQVKRHLRQEEALLPDAVFAEIVHLPEGRLGNILFRPVLREYEIPFLGQGRAAEDHQIPVTDLRVSVRENTVELHSVRLGKQVVPRLTTAHNYSFRSLGIYKFLCKLQTQRTLQGYWSWGPMDGFSFLPRVTCGRLVLSLARWIVTAEELRPIRKAADPAGRFRAVQELRASRRLPRLVLLADDDNKLLVDLDNVLSVDSFLAVAKGRPSVRLCELFPGPDQLCVRGGEGRFVHELVIPFVRRKERAAAAPPAPTFPGIRRAFAPGSEWLYFRLCCGYATVDRLLSEVVHPVVRQVTASGAVDRWFFLRYGDPEWHLRLRFHGDPRRLTGEVLPRVREAVAPMMDHGLVWKSVLDTYHRELERYGGDAGIELSEKLFHADSEAALTLLGMLAGDGGSEARWRLALRGSYQLLLDFGFDEAARFEIMATLQQGFAKEFNVGPAFKQQLAARLRKERRDLAALLQPEPDPGHPLAPAFEVLDQRSRDVAPLAAELREQAEAGRLTTALPDLVISFIHMFNNRMLRSDPRAHELVLYDFLYHTARSLAARRRQQAAG